MAKITGTRADMTLPQYTDRIIVQEHRGKLLVKSWPRPRGKNISPVTVLQNRKFKNAQMIAKYAPGNQIAMSIAMAKKGPLYPRDYLTAAMTRGFYVFTLPDGRTIYPMSQIIEISQELDAFTQYEGGMLARGNKLWEAIPPGLNGQLLVYPADNKVAQPRDPGMDLGGLHQTGWNRGGASVSAFATKGFLSSLSHDMHVHYLLPTWNSVSGQTVVCWIAELSGTTITAVVAQSLPITLGFTGLDRFPFEMTTSPMLERFKKYAFLMTRTDSTIFAHPGLYGASDQGTGGFPARQDLGWCYFTTNAIGTGAVAAGSGIATPFCLDVALWMKA